MNSPRSPNVNSLRALYKASNIGGGGNASGNGDNSNQSPSWRDSYKKRCFDEFKKSRQKLLNKFRKFEITDGSTKPKTERLKDYLEEELEKICLLEAKVSKELINIDEAAEIYKQIQQELIGQEQYDFDFLSQQEAVLHSEIQSVNTRVICPLCQKSELQDNTVRQRIECSRCLFKIDTQKTGLTLDSLEARLENAVGNHCCPEVPQFKIIQQPKTDDLCFLMLCDHCEFLYSII